MLPFGPSFNQKGRGVAQLVIECKAFQGLVFLHYIPDLQFQEFTVPFLETFVDDNRKEMLLTDSRAKQYCLLEATHEAFESTSDSDCTAIKGKGT